MTLKPQTYLGGFTERPLRIRQQAKRRWKRSSQTLRQQLLKAYGSKCRCCKERHPAFLTLEHRHHDGKEHRATLGTSGVYRQLRQLGFPKDDYELLCWNCNMATRYGTPCPHTKVSSITLPSVGRSTSDPDEHSGSASCPTPPTLRAAGQSLPGSIHPVLAS